MLYSLAEVSLIDVDAALFEILSHPAFVHEHGFSFGDCPDSVGAENFIDNPVMLLGVLGPVDVDSVLLHPCFRHLQIAVEICEGVEFYLRCEIAHFLPFRNL